MRPLTQGELGYARCAPATPMFREPSSASSRATKTQFRRRRRKIMSTVRCLPTLNDNHVVARGAHRPVVDKFTMLHLKTVKKSTFKSFEKKKKDKGSARTPRWKHSLKWQFITPHLYSMPLRHWVGITCPVPSDLIHDRTCNESITNHFLCVHIKRDASGQPVQLHVNEKNAENTNERRTHHSLLEVYHTKTKLPWSSHKGYSKLDESVQLHIH